MCAHWLIGHAVTERGRERVRLLLDEHTLYTQAAYHLLTYGGKIRVTAPDSLKISLAEIAESLARYYRE